MLRLIKSPGFGLLIGYLCLFFCFFPVRTEGALLESSPAGGETAAERAAVVRLEELGLTRQEAETRLAAYRRAGVDFSGLTFRAGGDQRGVGQQRYNYDPPINNIGLVFLIMAIPVGIGLYAGSRD